MRWFHREFEDDAGFDEAVDRYQRHIATLEPRLTPELRTLAGLSLHDGLIERLTLNERTGNVTLRLVIGDRQRGYSRIRLRYEEASVASPAADLRWLIEYKRTELLYHEIDRAEERYIHRLQFWPAGELHITFAALQLQVTDADERTRATGPELRRTRRDESE